MDNGRRGRMLTTFVAILVCIGGTAALQIKNQRMTTRQLSFPGFGAEIALFEFTFDNNVTVTIDGVATSFADLAGSTIRPTAGNNNDNGPPATADILKAGGLVDVFCNISGTTTVFRSDSPNLEHGPPTGSMVVLPTDEPAATFLRTMSGYNFPAAVHTDRVAVVVIMRAVGDGNNLGNARFDGHFNTSTMGNGQCKVRFHNDTVLLHSVEHPTVNFTGNSDPFVVEDNICDLIGGDRVTVALQQFATVASNITTVEASDALNFVAGSFTVFESWAGCTDKIKQMYTTKTTSRLVTNVNSCLYKFGTAAYRESPCCNRTLQYSQCCAPHVASIPFTTFDEITIPDGMCNHPDSVRPILLSYLEATERFEKYGDSIGNNNAAWDTYTKVQRDCSDALSSASCLTDGDCTYTQSCNPNSQTCNFDWDHPQLPYARCYVDKADPALLNELLRIWNVDPLSDTLAEDVAAVWIARYSTLDCAGPSAELWRRRMVTAYDAQGNPFGLIVPGNETGCLEKQVCNWNSWQNGDDAELCAGASVLSIKGDHFCGNKQGGNSNYFDLTVMPQCQVTMNIQSQAECLALGASTHRWESFPGGAGGGSCFYTGPGAVNLTLCLSSPFCAAFRTTLQNAIDAGTYNPYSQQFNFDIDCGNSWCYFENITTQNQCTHYQQLASHALQGHTADFLFNGLNSLAWDDTHQLCRFGSFGLPPSSMNSTFCQAAATFINATTLASYSEARTFRPGSWSTAQECARGQCTVPSLNYFGVTSQACAAATYCTKQCAYCSTFQRDPTGLQELTLCYNPSITTQQTCLSPGKWNMYNLPTTANNNGGGGGSQHSACVYDYSATQCADAGFTYRSCGQLLTETRCNNYSTGFDGDALQWAYKAIGCQWNAHANCRTAQECTAQGECNDQEFQSFSSNNGPNPFSDGACVRPFDIDPTTGNQQPCDEHVSRQSRTGCVFNSVTNQDDCVALGDSYTWETRAATAAACSAHGKGCKAPDWNGPNLIGRDADECALCSGTMEDQFTFSHGEVVSGSMQTLTWLDRKMVSENSWQATLDFQLLGNDVSAAVAAVLAKGLIAAMNAQFSAVLPMLQTIACDCSGGPSREDCFDAVQIPDCSCTLLPGLDTPQTCSCAGGATYTFPPGSITGTRPVQIYLSNVPAGFAIAAPSTANPPNACSCRTDTQTGNPICDCRLVRRYDVATDSFKFQTLTGSNLMAANTKFLKGNVLATDTASGAPFTGDPNIIRDYLGNVVGQVVGSARIFISDSSVTYPISACMPIDFNIQQDNITYPIPDFTQPNLLIPLNASVTVNGNQLCGLIPANGTYYPIIREINWNHTTIIVPPTSSSTGAAASSSSSDLIAGLTITQWEILGGVLGPFVIVGLAVTLWYFYCRKPGSTGSRYKRGIRVSTNGGYEYDAGTGSGEDSRESSTNSRRSGQGEEGGAGDDNPRESSVNSQGSNGSRGSRRSGQGSGRASGSASGNASEDEAVELTAAGVHPNAEQLKDLDGIRHNSHDVYDQPE